MTRLAAPFLLGLLVAFDAVLPVGANVRTGDLVSLLCVCLFVWNLMAGRGVDRGAVVLGVVLLVSVEWLLAETLVAGSPNADTKVQIVLARWLLGAFTAYMMLRLSNAPRTRTALFLGLVAGTMCGFETVIRDWQTFDLTTQMPTLNLEDLVFIDGEYRASGMYSHPNEAAGIVLLAAPIILGLVEERRLPRISLLAVAVLAGAVFWITKSRSQAVVVVLLLGLWAARNSPRLLLLAAAGGAVAGLAAMLDMLPGISGDAVGQRLLDPNIGYNFAGRLSTIIESFNIAIQHPFGVGSTYVDTLYRETGFTATHNALLQLAMMGGTPLLVVVFAGLFRCASSLLLRRTSHGIEGWLALYLLCVFNVENYFYDSVMSVLTLFLVAAAWSRRPVAVSPEPALDEAKDRRLPALRRVPGALPALQGNRRAIGRAS